MKPDKQFSKSIQATQRRRARITTMNDILARDDVNDILENLDKRKDSLSALVVIAVDRSGETAYFTTEQTLSELVYRLEEMKFTYMNDTEED